MNRNLFFTTLFVCSFMAACGEPVAVDEPAPPRVVVIHEAPTPDVDPVVNAHEPEAPRGSNELEKEPAAEEPPAPVIEDEPPVESEAGELELELVSTWGPRGGTFDDLFSEGEFVYLTRRVGQNSEVWRTADQRSWEELPGLSGRLVQVKKRGLQLFALTEAGETYRFDEIYQRWVLAVGAPSNGMILHTHDDGVDDYALFSAEDRSLSVMRWTDTGLAHFADVTGASGMIHGGFAVRGEKILAWPGYGPAVVLDGSGRFDETFPHQEASLHVTMLSYKDRLVFVDEHGVWISSPDLTEASRLSSSGATEAALSGDTLFVGPSASGHVYTLDLSEEGMRPTYGASIEPHQRDTATKMIVHAGEPLLLFAGDGPARVEVTSRGYESWRSISPGHRPVVATAQVGEVMYALDDRGLLFASVGDQRWEPKLFGARTASELVRFRGLVAQRGMLYLETTSGDVLTIAWADSLVDARVVATASFGATLGVFEGDGEWLFAAPEARGVIFGGGLFGAPNGATHWSDWSMLHSALPERWSIYYTAAGAPHVADVATAGERWWTIGSNIGVRASMDEGSSWVDVTPPGFEVLDHASADASSGKAGSLPTPYRYWIEASSELLAASDGVSAWIADTASNQWREVPLELEQHTVLRDMEIIDGRVVLATNKDLRVIDPSAASSRALSLAWGDGYIRSLRRSGDELFVHTNQGVYTLALPSALPDR